MKPQKKTMSRCFSTLTLFAGVLSVSESTIAHPMIQYWQNRTGSHEGFTLEPRVGFFSSSSNYGQMSQLETNPNSATLTQYRFDLNGGYGITDDFFLFGRLSLLSTQSKALGQNDMSAFGLSDQLLGAAYRLFSSDAGMSINLQGEVVIPAYSNSNSLTQGTPYLGDGSTDFTAGVFGEFPLHLLSTRDWFFEVGAGYTYRSNGFSTAIPWNASIKRDPAVRGMVAVAGILGQASLKTDIATNDTTALARTNSDRLLGSYGSMVINGVNPEWKAFRGSLGYKNGKGQTIYATIINPLSGTSIPSGTAIALGATLDFSPHETVAFEDEIEKPRTKKRKLKNQTEFASYNLNAQVTSVNDQLYIVKIDKGSADNIQKGQFFDIFQDDRPLARARVTHLKTGEAVLTVIEYYQDHWIEVGSTARRLVQ